ncbi:uncharacterized protein LOC106013370 [Aplysia californica]|uniref:Uncharacterized protein LOC106013370 n=1 Tax=Aplysia californica TaxID=6500 RepID=A0ABM1AB65_APLCA|nr:uncharacterized protein LOC106013370 [Aplysia californica]
MQCEVCARHSFCLLVIYCLYFIFRAHSAPISSEAPGLHPRSMNSAVIAMGCNVTTSYVRHHYFQLEPIIGKRDADSRDRQETAESPKNTSDKALTSAVIKQTRMTTFQNWNSSGSLMDDLQMWIHHVSWTHMVPLELVRGLKNCGVAYCLEAFNASTDVRKLFKSLSGPVPLSDQSKTRQSTDHPWK